MKKTLLLTLFFFTASLISYAQKTIFEGLIDSKNKIRLTLSVNGEEVKGNCANASTETNHAVEGTLNEGVYRFFEKNKSGDTLGLYIGEVIANYLFKGSFTAKKATEEQQILLTKIEGNAITPLTDFFASSSPSKIIKANKETYKRGNINAVLVEFQNCIANSSESRKCREYIAKVACRFYGISDFLLDEETDTYVSMKDMPAFVMQHELWNKAGMATEKGVFDSVIPKLLEGKAAIAFNTKEDYTHVAVLLPGDGAASGSWGGVVPNAASFFVWKPEKSFTNRTLNYAFSRPNGIEIWIRE